MSRKPNGYWKKEENIIAEAKQAMNEQGWKTLPSAAVLLNAGFASLSTAIHRHFDGGILALRQYLGQESNKKPNNYWKNPDIILSEVQRAMNEKGWETLPSQSTLQKSGYSSLLTAIQRYFPDGLPGVRKHLGQQYLMRPHGYWQDTANIEAEAHKAMEEQGWETLPVARILNDAKYSGLAFAAYNYYPGGINALRERLGQNIFKRTQGYWQKPDNVIAEVLKAMNEQRWKTLPSSTAISRAGYGALLSAIDKNYPGKTRALREHLGQEQLVRQSGYWKKEDNIITEAQQTLINHNWNTLPSYDCLNKHGHSSLGAAICKYYPGGIRQLREDLQREKGMQTPAEKLEQILDEYVGDEC